MKKLRVSKKLQYPIDDNIQKFIDDVDSEYYSYTIAVKALKMAGRRAEFILQHEDTDDFDLQKELGNSQESCYQGVCW